jgi:hypothetical protein
MKRMVLLMLAGIVLTACSNVAALGTPELIETEQQLVSGCQPLGFVTETADAGNPFSAYARVDMLAKVRSRALKLGATHIVWLHKTPTSAAAEAYRCESQ